MEKDGRAGRDLADLNRDDLLKTARELLAQAQGLSSRLAQLDEINVDVATCSRSVEEVMNVTKEKAKWAFDYDYFSACLHGDDGTRMVLFSGEAPAEDVCEVDATVWALQYGQPTFEQDATGKVVPPEYASWMVLPLKSEGETLGTLNIASEEPNAYARDDQRLANMFVLQVAAALRNARRLEVLQHTRDEIEQINRVKNDFISLASQELRTPLATIIGYADMLREDERPTGASVAGLTNPIADIRKAAADIHDVVKQMGRVDLLRHRPEALSFQSVTLSHVLREALQEKTALAEMRDQTVRFNLPKREIRLHADPTRLQLVFTSLLENALQYAPEGSDITVHVSEEKKEAHIEVINPGEGISKEEQNRVFRESYQVEDHLNRMHGGLGLGLTIAREAVRLHDGEIWLRDGEAGEGTIICVSLPIRKITKR